MHIRFTKMHGAGNDFIVLDETAGALGLTAAQYRFLAHRHFGVGADQILGVRAASRPDVDFAYTIHNADGGQVQQCGNGARCFARYVYDRGLTDKRVIRVQTLAGVIAPQLHADGRVTVNMGQPTLDTAQLPFDTRGLTARPAGASRAAARLWPLELAQVQVTAWVAAVSMGNPHAVQQVADVDSIPVAQWGPLLERHPRFAQRVNAGFMQILDRRQIRLRVYERGAGETLSCGSGACAAVVAGVLLGLLDTCVQVHTRGGRLDIAWSGNVQDSVYLTGPTAFVFDGHMDIPDILPDLEKI